MCVSEEEGKESWLTPGFSDCREAETSKTETLEAELMRGDR